MATSEPAGKNLEWSAIFGGNPRNKDRNQMLQAEGDRQSPQGIRGARTAREKVCEVGAKIGRFFVGCGMVKFGRAQIGKTKELVFGNSH